MADTIREALEEVYGVKKVEITETKELSEESKEQLRKILDDAAKDDNHPLWDLAREHGLLPRKQREDDPYFPHDL